MDERMDVMSLPKTTKNLLDARLSAEVAGDVLRAIVRNAKAEDLPEPLKSVVCAAGADVVSPVYEMTGAGIETDSCGLAREVKLHLKNGIDPTQAIDVLNASDLVESVQPVGLAKPW